MWVITPFICVTCERDVSLLLLGILLGHVEGYPIRESHTFSAEIFPAHTPARTSTRILWMALGCPHNTLVPPRPRTDVALHITMIPRRDSAGISAKGVRPHQRQMGGLQTISQRTRVLLSRLVDGGKIEFRAQGTLHSHSNQITCICICSRS